MICLVCRSCRSIFRVRDAGQSELFAEIVSEGLCCPRCQGPVEATKFNQISDEVLQYFSVSDLTSMEFFRAQHGLGLPDEQECDVETVRLLLASHAIVAIHGKDVVNTSRAVLESLELASGHVLHLSSSAHGAVVYRITKPRESHESR